MKGGDMNNAIITQPLDTKLLPTLPIRTKVLQWY